MTAAHVVCLYFVLYLCVLVQLDENEEEFSSNTKKIEAIAVQVSYLGVLILL